MGPTFSFCQRPETALLSTQAVVFHLVFLADPCVQRRSHWLNHFGLLFVYLRFVLGLPGFPA